MTQPTDGARWQQLATELAENPDLCRRLLRDHVPDGGRCTACTAPGTGCANRPWPCSIHKLAALAHEIHDDQARGAHRHVATRRSGTSTRSRT